MNIDEVIAKAIERRWECPNCHLLDVTHEPLPHTRMHHCRGLKGMWAPMVPAGTKAKVEAVVRGDYVGGEQVRVNNEGTPIMATVTTRDDGQDCAVYAPVASARKADIDG